jgi:hypothetical protein
MSTTTSSTTIPSKGVTGVGNKQKRNLEAIRSRAAKRVKKQLSVVRSVKKERQTVEEVLQLQTSETGFQLHALVARAEKKKIGEHNVVQLTLEDLQFDEEVAPPTEKQFGLPKLVPNVEVVIWENSKYGGYVMSDLPADILQLADGKTIEPFMIVIENACRRMKSTNGVKINGRKNLVNCMSLVSYLEKYEGVE